MLAVAGLCALTAVVLAAPLLLPIVKPSLSQGVQPLFAGIHGAFWFVFKVSAYLYLFMWLRFTLPRYRFDQLMRLGWRFLIPLSIINIMAVGLALVIGAELGLNRWVVLAVTTALTLGVALWLMATGDEREAKPGVVDSYAR